MKIFSWIFLVLGLWLTIAPFVFGYTAVARWNDVIVGLAIGIIGFISLESEKEN